MLYRTINPTTEQEVARFDLHTEEAVESMIEVAARAFGTWRKTSLPDRGKALIEAADLLERDLDLLARELRRRARVRRGGVERAAAQPRALPRDLAKHRERVSCKIDCIIHL